MRNPALIADELRSMAHAGLLYSGNVYDQHRYLKLMELSAEVAQLEIPAPKPELVKAYLQQATHICPLMGADAVVIQDGKLLLIRRKDTGLWALPGGTIDVGESVSEAAVRELFEETGLRATPVRLLGVFDAKVWRGRSLMHFYQMVTLLELQGGELQTTLETLDAKFWPLDGLPELDEGHRLMVPHAIKMLQTGETHLDLLQPSDLKAQDPPKPRKRVQNARYHLVQGLVQLLFLLQRTPLRR
ncbi:NUDIX hydrolase N-terminal domain-containing protein [Deinococcus cellulosilyticus]|uniref:Nudix hydrolase domain-containing protein n=1 Tax=Deinococcus cellulosilyticus (strain DSM 18568 / NBRC 106333 / KACC 11606 / 5516J-15) TaxID=1223518 RepID=A0A511MYJ9_DEIC1|nr:NUDIX hydrolase N-terminal domain-containing protein [Deinococcus cellulosilyticus]GEM45431.1 hypothetical protein DC3_10660 [Deinococcus cellulosilyticus NBRC 106333 = KACC 11606]